jgi:circadian clock protein KaiC
MNDASARASSNFAQTGVEGLDDILGGGLTPDRLYLLQGVPGSGKTTLALQFLLEGVARGEKALYVTLSETEDELRSVAQSHGWDLSQLAVRELVPAENTLQADQQYTMFHPSEVELTETTKTILADVEKYQPRRIVFDSLSELRLLAGNPLKYRRQILVLKQYFAGRQCTVLLLDDMTSADHDLQVQSISHGVILLEQVNPEYGSDRRRMRVVKYRGVKFRGGYHDYIIDRGGLQVFPRLVAAEHRQPINLEKLSSGIEGLDHLLGGGVDRGSSTLIVGSAGTGKSTVAAQFCATAAERGQQAVMFVFDENRETLLKRTSGLGIDLAGHVETGRVFIQQIDPAELSPGQFTDTIRKAVVDQQASVLVIDSLNGYLNAMPGEKYLAIQLHELLMYLGQQGVATILIGAHQGMIGSQMVSPVDASYLADSVILMRYFEAVGEVRQSIAVIKKRGGPHERSIREFLMRDGKILVGPPLSQFRGVLTGVPTMAGSDSAVQKD